MLDTIDQRPGGWHHGGCLSRRVLGALVLFSMVAAPAGARAQIEVAAGVVVVPEGGAGETQVGPALSVRALTVRLGVPVFLEAGAGRTDFVSLGQAYHDSHYLLAVGAEWVPIKGTTSLGLRLGIGGYGEYQTVETDPPTEGGDNWTEMIQPGIALGRELGSGRQLVLAISDAVLGPVNALLDSGEFDIEHRVRIMVGLRF